MREINPVITQNTVIVATYSNHCLNWSICYPMYGTCLVYIYVILKYLYISHAFLVKLQMEFFDKKYL